MRHLAQDLRPTLLDTLGLKSALETYCQEFSSRTNLPVSFQMDPSSPRTCLLKRNRYLDPAKLYDQGDSGGGSCHGTCRSACLARARKRCTRTGRGLKWP